MDAFMEEFVLGAWQANCYVLGDRETGTGVIIDPGQDAAEHVTAALDAHGVRPEAVLLTHGHLDHLWSVPELVRALDVPVFLHPGDRWLWDNPAQAFGDLPVELLEREFGLRWSPGAVRPEDLSDGQRLTLGGLSFEVRHTPGHTPGSCVFWLRAGDGPVPVGQILGADLLLSGDLIFAGSVGRTDFPRGSHADLLASIERSVLPLSDETVIASGHGPRTTVGAERDANPFLT
jgi:glyoxylase-like metal-dependent hydrolase (beta-lactamase superfamily II)